ncbi:hypothetical protein [Endozoicomonas sp. SESOKO1]|nr:hypothetical protein [Endozoicomonas sp. SESOKO1]
MSPGMMALETAFNAAVFFGGDFFAGTRRFAVEVPGLPISSAGPVARS